MSEVLTCVSQITFSNSVTWLGSFIDQESLLLSLLRALSHSLYQEVFLVRGRVRNSIERGRSSPTQCTDDNAVNNINIVICFQMTDDMSGSREKNDRCFPRLFLLCDVCPLKCCAVLTIVMTQCLLSYLYFSPIQMSILMAHIALLKAITMQNNSTHYWQLQQHGHTLQ